MASYEIGRVEAVGAQLDARVEASSRGYERVDRQEPNERNEIVSLIRAAVREGGLPEWARQLESSNNEMQIAFDRDSKKYVVRLLDRTTQEVVRQIPAEDVLSRARYFVETAQKSALQNQKS
jgi:uncharacterized FlaG/YvyC family protein